MESACGARSLGSRCHTHVPCETPEVRRVIYTTNAIESLSMSLRKIIKTLAAFPSEQAATKLLYLALKNVMRGWQRGGSITGTMR